MYDNKERIKKLIKDYLLILYLKDVNSARSYELYDSVAHSLRSFLSKDWYETKKEHNREKTSYLLSFEYLPGKGLTRIAKNLGLYEDLRESLFELGIDFEKLVEEEKEPSLGNGSMGINSHELLNEYANNEQMALGYGLRYKGGMFNQEIINGAQMEEGEYWLNREVPWEHKKGFEYKIEFKDFTVKAIAYDMPVVGYKNHFINTFRLWSTEFPDGVDFETFSSGNLLEAFELKNKSDSIVEFLYPENTSGPGRELRLYQEYFFVSASIQDIFRRFFSADSNRVIEDIDKFVDIKINDIHPILAIAEFIRILTVEYKQDIYFAIKKAKNIFSYVNFGIVNESFENWNLDQIGNVCPKLLDTLYSIDRINKEENIGRKDEYLPIINDNSVSLFNLALYGSNSIYALSSNHKEEIKYLINDEQYHKNVKNIKMGTSHINWLVDNNDLLSDYIYDLVGDFANDVLLLENLKYFENDKAVLEDIKLIKEKNKKDFTRKVLKNRNITINPYSIFDMQLERIHEYKRQLLNGLNIAYLYFMLRENPNLFIPERTYFFSGKASKTYFFAKEVIKFINALAYMINKDLLIKDKIKIVFIPNINITKLEEASKACDIYENLSSSLKETGVGHSYSFMMNGAINLSTTNGALDRSIKDVTDEDLIYTFDRDQELAYESLENIYYSNSKMRFTIDHLINSRYNIFPYDFNIIYRMLLQYNDGYDVVRDMTNYSDAHKKISYDFYDVDNWNKRVLKNIAYSNNFAMKNTLNNFE